MTDARPQWMPEDEDDDGFGVDISRLLLGYKLILLSGAIIGAGLGYWMFTRTPPEFSSTARLHVVQKQIDSPIEAATGQARVNTGSLIDEHADIIQSPVIVEDAVRLGKLTELPTLRGAGDPVARVIAGLRASRSRGSERIMQLSYRSRDAAVCKQVLDAIILAYVEYVRKAQQSDNAEQLGRLVDERDKIAERIAEKEKDYQDFRDHTPLLFEGGVARNIHQERLSAIEQQRRQMRLEEKLLRAELDAINEALENGSDPDGILLMALERLPQAEEIVTKADLPEFELPELPVSVPMPYVEPEFDDSRSKVLPLLLRERQMSLTHGPEHPDMVALRNEIRLTQETIREETALRNAEKMRVMRERHALAVQQAKELAAATAAREKAIREAEAAAEETRTVTEPDLLKTYLQSVETRINKLDRQTKLLDQEYATEEQASRTVAYDENRDRVLREDLDRENRYYEAYSEKLQAISFVENEQFLNVKPIDYPKVGTQVAPKLTDNLLLGTLLGLVAALAVAFLIESADQSFRSPEDVMKGLRLPVIAHIPELDKLKKARGSRLDKTLVAYHRPKSRLAEAYRSIRTPLMFKAERDGLKVLQVTSPDPGDGKSTLAANLAVTLASSGKRVLLVDADFRRPRVEQLFDLKNSLGFADFITGEADLPDLIHDVEAENLDVMTTGTKPGNVTELVLSPRFDEAIDTLKEKYEFIIIDSPPVLAVTDASALATKADAVLLVLRITKRVQVDSVRARKTLEMVGANFLGVVVNTRGRTEYSPVKRGYYSSKAYDYSAYAGYGSYYSTGSYHEDNVREVPSPNPETAAIAADATGEESELATRS